MDQAKAEMLKHLIEILEVTTGIGVGTFLIGLGGLFYSKRDN